MSFNRYSLTTKEFYDQGLITLSKHLKNIKPEFIKKEIERFLKKVEEYDLAKKQYDSLTEEERIKFEIEVFQQDLKREIKETSNIRFLLLHGKTHDDSDEYNYDNDYLKTLTIVSDFEAKRKYFEKILKDKIANLRFDPPLTVEKESELVQRMLINEFGRLNNNLISYNYFLSFLSSYYKCGEVGQLSNFNSFKINVLMFLLDMDYENNTSMYENYSFPDISISYIENHIKRDGSEDSFTIKAKNKNYAKILRDAASHGEFYPNDQRNIFAHMNFIIQEDDFIINESNIVRIENSKGIPRIGINLQYGLLHDFVMNNLSDETKEKYDYLVKIVKANSFEEVLNNYDNNALNQMLALMLNNIVQYNIEHHFKETENEIDNLNLSMFSFFDENNNGIDITSSLSNKDKLMNIKNAIGHNHITWNDNELILKNDWIPSNSGDNRAPIKRRIVCSKDQLIEFLLQNDLYSFATTNQLDNSIINRRI